VLKLRKALYGLRQAPRAWNARLDKDLLSMGFIRSKLEHAVYMRSNSKSFLIVGVYVDDLIISGPNLGDIKQFKALFSSQKILQNFSDSPSHRIFRRMHRVLNIDENKN